MTSTTDPTYGPKVHHENNGDSVVVESGGDVTVLSGGTLDVQSGGTLNLEAGSTITAAAGLVVSGVKVAKAALAALDTGGGVLAWANPEAVSIIISRVVLDITTKSTGACTLDVGTTAANATTKVDNLIDGVDVGTGAGVFSTIDQAGANGKERAKLAAGKWVTASMDSGAAAGLVGSAYIYYTLT